MHEIRRLAALLLLRRGPLLPAAALLLAPVSALHAQAGGVAGRVTAEATGRPLGDVRVSVVGTARVTTTDSAGAFRLPGLAAGEYELVATRLGREAVRTRVTVPAGATARADFALGEGSLLLPGVVVTAARAEQRAREVAATVNVLSRERVATSTARTTDDLLRELPGVELPRTSSTVSGPEQIVSMRGADEGRTLVLLDGVPLNDPWGEWIQWNRAPRFQIDRVEAVEGGGSSVWGNYAMGGVIQLFSRPIAARGYQVMASGGSRDAGDVSLYASDVVGRLGFSVGADYGTGGGYTVLRQAGPVDEPSEVERRNVSARAEYAVGSASTVYASASYFDDDRSLGTDLVGPNQRQIVSGVVGGSFGDVAGGRLQVSAFGQDQRYESHSSSVNATRTAELPLVAQQIPTQDVGGAVQWSRPMGVFESVSIGADGRHMVGELQERLFAAGAPNGGRVSGGTQQVGGAFLAGVLAPAPGLRVEASARVDAWRSTSGSRTATSAGGATTSEEFADKKNVAFAPRLGVRYAPARGLAVRGSLFRAFRAPSLSEEYRTIFAGPNQLRGNPALGPEYLNGYDLGVEWQPLRAVELRATVFRNFYQDLASFVPSGTPGVSQRQNVGTARSQGVEAELALHLLDALTLAGSYNYDDARVTSGATAGAWVNRVPQQRAAARLTWADRRVGTANVVYRYEGMNHTLQGARLAPFAVVDLQLQREAYRGAELFVGVENLLDREYTVNYSGALESLGLPRTVRGGIVVRSF